MSEMKQVIVIRRDLKMRRGKEIAQGSHASMAFLLVKRANGLIPYTNDENKWINNGQKKVTLQVNTESELLALHEKAIALGLTSHIITDSGKTEFNGVPTKTCMAIGPNDSDTIDLVTGHLELY